MVKSAKKIVSSRAFLCEYWTTEEKTEKTKYTNYT